MKSKSWLVIFILSLILMSGGCGGSGSDDYKSGKRELFVLGDMHGDLSEEIAERVDCVPFTGFESGSPLLISYNSGFSIDEETATAARLLLEDGQAVGVEHATEDEVNALLEALGFEHAFRMPSGHSYVEFFGIKLLEDGDLLTYVALNDDEHIPAELQEEPETVMIGENLFVSNDELPFAMTPEYLRELADYRLTVSGDMILSGDRVLDEGDVTSGDLMLAPDGQWIPQPQQPEAPSSPKDDEDLLQLSEDGMADGIIEWLYYTEQQQAYVRRSKADVRGSLAGGNDLASISKMYQKTYDASCYGQTFKIIVDIYACHSFNQADGIDSDWFFVKQTGQLNPASNYSKTSSTLSIPAKIRGYMVDYAFDNYLVDAAGNIVNADVALQQPKPDSTVGSTGIDSSISVNFGGNVGFSGLAGAGGVSAGVSFSSSQSQTVPECQVNNQSLQNVSGVVQQHAKWLYTFSRPQTTGGKAFAFNNFNDAPTAARSLFQPVNQWAWRIGPTQRDKVKGFKFKFRWKNGYSYSESFAWGIRVTDVEHYDWVERETEFNVTFDAIYPPLIAANGLDFPKAGGHKPLMLATCRSWSASSDSSWCQLSKTSGTLADLDNVFVTVDENETGQNREAHILLKTTDGSNGSSSVRIFQARN